MTISTDPRHLVRLRVEMTGSDESGNRFKQTAFTHDVSLRGARISDAPSFLSAATVVEVKYRGKRSRFRVVWVGIATNDIGLLSMDPRLCIWGTPLPGRRIHSVPPSPVKASPVPPAFAQPIAAPKALPTASPSVHPGSTEGVEPNGKPVGYYCKDDVCRQRRVFHRIPVGTVVWDIWPQKFECPATGHRHEYSKGEVRSAGYA